MSEPVAAEPRTYFCCPDCRSTRVQAQMWVRPNTNEVLDDTERYSWCDACEERGDPGDGGDYPAGDYGEKHRLDLSPWAETREGLQGVPEPSALDPLEVLRGVAESLELCERELPEMVWRCVRGYFHKTAQQVRELTQ